MLPNLIAIVGHAVVDIIATVVSNRKQADFATGMPLKFRGN